MLRKTGIFRANEAVVDRAMDSNDLEREKGITILAKNTAVTYRGVKVNSMGQGGGVSGQKSAFGYSCLRT